MRAARDWGVPPTRFLHEWSSRDRSLALALSVYEDEGYASGVPNKVATDPDSNGHIVAVPYVDERAAAIERAQQNDKTPEPGKRWFAADVRVNPEYEKYAD